MALNSPFIVPIAVFAWLSIVVVAKIIGEAHTRRVIADQRIAMLQRGMTLEQIEAVLKPINGVQDDLRPRSPLRSLNNARRAAVILICSGAGLSAFGLILTSIVQEREVLTVAAAGLIPIAIGIGFFIDYVLQKRDLTHFGLAADSTASR